MEKFGAKHNGFAMRFSNLDFAGETVTGPNIIYYIWLDYNLFLGTVVGTFLEFQPTHLHRISGGIGFENDISSICDNVLFQYDNVWNGYGCIDKYSKSFIEKFQKNKFNFISPQLHGCW